MIRLTLSACSRSRVSRLVLAAAALCAASAGSVAQGALPHRSAIKFTADVGEVATDRDLIQVESLAGSFTGLHIRGVEGVTATAVPGVTGPVGRMSLVTRGAQRSFQLMVLGRDDHGRLRLLAQGDLRVTLTLGGKPALVASRLPAGTRSVTFSFFDAGGTILGPTSTCPMRTKFTVAALRPGQRALRRSSAIRCGSPIGS